MVARRDVPLRIKLRVALRQAGLDPDHVRLDHDPALGLRQRNADTGEFDPHEHDERYLVWLSTKTHDAKTYGDHVPLSGDISKIAKAKRVNRKHEEFRARLLTKEPGKPREKRGKIRSRGFQKRAKR